MNERILGMECSAIKDGDNYGLELTISGLASPEHAALVSSRLRVVLRENTQQIFGKHAECEQ